MVSAWKIRVSVKNECMTDDCQVRQDTVIHIEVKEVKKLSQMIAARLASIAVKGGYWSCMTIEKVSHGSSSRPFFVVNLEDGLTADETQ
jgi:hypothetical protein